MVEPVGVEPTMHKGGGFTVHWGYQFSYDSKTYYIETFSISVPYWHKEPFAPARGPNIGRARLAVTVRQKCFYIDTLRYAIC